MTERVEIAKLPTGIAGFDEALGGGIPEFSFNVIAGGPGAGKTTLSHQIMFAAASPERPALYVTILGEPPLKMLRYQQQYSFFDQSKVGNCIQFLHLGSELVEHGLEGVLDRIIEEVNALGPQLVFVDSFRAVVNKSREDGQMELQAFVQRLALHLTSWEATTFLIGEYEESEAESNPIFTIADGIFWLTQHTSRGATTRRVQVVKMRGQAALAGVHSFKISNHGLDVFPRRAPLDAKDTLRPAGARLSTGIDGFDEMLGGGIPAGYSLLIVGPPGSGKTILATRFIREGTTKGEHGLIAQFERRPEQYLKVTPDAEELTKLVATDQVRVLHLRPLDLTVEETMDVIATNVRAIGAKRVVLDSLAGFELSLAPEYRDDFHEALYRLVGALTHLGVTVMMTSELTDTYGELRLSPYQVSFLTDVIVLQRYTEISGELRKVMVVVKLRGFDHSKQLRLYDIGPDGLVVGDALANYEGILTGTPRRVP